MKTMEGLCREHDLLSLGKDNIVRVPFLVKGTLRVPPVVGMDRIQEAFSAKEKATGKPAIGVTTVRLEDAQVLREPVIDRETMRRTDEFVYQVLPGFDPEELIERDFDRVVKELYNLPFEEVLGFLGKVSSALSACPELLKELEGVYRRTAAVADLYIRFSFSSLGYLLNPDSAREMVDSELSSFGIKGSRFMDTWVQVSDTAMGGLSEELSPREGKETHGDCKSPEKMYLRAMPTRQLHLTAGNAPAIPIISTCRAISLKSPAVIKSPYGATLGGALVSLAACAAAPDHPNARNLSIVYWQGGDESVEDVFFGPEAFDRIVIWGAPDAVASVKRRALFTKLLTLNPRYGMSWIGREAFGNDDFKEVARRGAVDTMIWNQKACISSSVHYVEGDENQVTAYAQALQKELAEWDRIAPNFLDPAAQGQIRRLRRGKLLNAQWLANKQNEGDRKNEGISSVVIVVKGEFDMMDHTLSRMVIVRPVSRLEDALPYLSHSVSTVGVFPESRRKELCDRILARGVSTTCPLGMGDRMSTGLAHDGMKVYSELVDWKNR
jgi:Acyl-CoA reductase (LuxC)